MDENNEQHELVDTENKSASKQNLDEVKQKALAALVPVISNLSSVGPERKFDICLTAMRFTDNSELAGTALEAALSIEEAGTKAEALVELINEIDYLQAQVAGD